MSYLYPRTITVTRPTKQTGVGAQPYGGATIATESFVVDDVPASIQQKKEGSAPAAGLPGDAVKRTSWRIFIPLAALADGVIQTHDVVTDDLGVRYQVGAPYWNSLGYNLLAERLES